MESASLVNSMEQAPPTAPPAPPTGVMGVATPTAPHPQQTQITKPSASLQPGSGPQPGSQPSSGRSSPYQAPNLQTVQPGTQPNVQGMPYNQQQQTQTMHQQQQAMHQQQQRQQALQQQQAMQQHVMQQQQQQQSVQHYQQRQAPQQQQYMAPPEAQPLPPTQQQLARFNFDPTSQAVLQGLGGRHPNSLQVPGYVNNALKEVMAKAGNPELPAGIQMEYQTLLDGILLAEETASDNYVAFRKVEFQYINDTKTGVQVPAKPSMSQGRAYMTNQRVILLCAEETKGLNLTSECNFKTSAYNVTGHKSYNLRYESIPLTCFRGVDMSAVYGYSASARIQGYMPDSLAQCLQPCCSGDVYHERWHPQQALAVSIDNRVLNLGVLLPPWETRCNVQVYVSKESELADAVEFIDALQRSAPRLQPESFSIPRQ